MSTVQNFVEFGVDAGGGGGQQAAQGVEARPRVIPRELLEDDEDAGAVLALESENANKDDDERRVGVERSRRNDDGIIIDPPKRRKPGEEDGDGDPPLEQEVEDLREQVEDLERARAIDRHVFESGAIDIESVALLVETRVDKRLRIGHGLDWEIKRIVMILIREKPFLFRIEDLGVASMGEGSSGDGTSDLQHSAQRARDQGDRRELLRYLRLRRGAN
ncbi:MAG: hypothetical protein AAGB51_13255 [Planctomycetota bacterium]